MVEKLLGYELIRILIKMKSIALGRGTVSLWVAGVLSVNHIIFLTFAKWRGKAKTVWAGEGFKNNLQQDQPLSDWPSRARDIPESEVFPTR